LKTFKHDFVTLPKLEKVTDENGRRHYITPSGNHYQSVTTLTSKVNAKEIQAWRDKVGEEEANKISKRAASRGTSVHKICEKYLLNELQSNEEGSLILEELNPINTSMFMKIKPLVERLDNIKLIEGTMYSDLLKLAGTADCIAEYNGELVLADFKTSTYPKKKEKIGNYFMQGAAYSRMYEELYGKAPTKIVIMMAVENMPHAITYVEPYEKCLDQLIKFMSTLENV
jgi:ATP-dependent exoDNAse (exonuclease V) beta subunit